MSIEVTDAPAPTNVLGAAKPLLEPEVVVAPAAAKAPESEALSPKIIALEKEKAKIRRQYQELKTQQEALKAKEAEYQSHYIPKSKLTENPLQALNELGISYDQLVDRLLNQPKPEDEKYLSLQNELKAVKEAQQKQVELAQKAQDSQYQQAVNQVRNEVKLLVDSNQDFESIKAMDAQESVVELIKKTFEESKGETLLTVEEAAKEVESYLVEQALRMASLNKVKAKLNAPQVNTESTTPPQQQSSITDDDLRAAVVRAKAQRSHNTTKTLTNATTASSQKPMTARERAMRAFSGQT